MKLTEAMKNQLLEYLMDVEDEGVYWGNKKQFWNRHQKIAEWLLEQETSR
jgi:hypothetical protein